MKSWKCPNCVTEKVTSDNIIICPCPCCLTNMVNIEGLNIKCLKKEIWVC